MTAASNGRPRKWQEEIDRVCDHVTETMRSRDILNHDQVERLTGMTRQSSGQEYYQMLKGVKKRLYRERKIRLQNVPKVGYRWLTGDERVDAECAVLRRAARDSGTATVRLAEIDQGEMSETYRHKRDKAVRIVYEAGRFIDSACKQLGLLLDPPETNPPALPPT